MMARFKPWVYRIINEYPEQAKEIMGCIGQW